MNSEIQLKKVEFIPKILEAGILYISERFNVAVHICPCGCKTKVVTPIGPGEWSFYQEQGKPSLRPSIGNWQIPCQSHYWIVRGQIEWSYTWTKEQIEAGRKEEESIREAYYHKNDRQRKQTLWQRVTNWIIRILNL